MICEGLSFAKKCLRRESEPLNHLMFLFPNETSDSCSFKRVTWYSQFYLFVDLYRLQREARE